jgi:hypothetical protein
MITKGMIDVCNNSLHQFSSVKMSSDGMRALIESDSILMAALINGYSAAQAGTDDTLDTYDREGLFDVFSTVVLGLDGWPIIGSDAETHAEFMDALMKAAQSKQIEIFA